MTPQSLRLPLNLSQWLIPGPWDTLPTFPQAARTLRMAEESDANGQVVVGVSYDSIVRRAAPLRLILLRPRRRVRHGRGVGSRDQARALTSRAKAATMTATRT